MIKKILLFSFILIFIPFIIVNIFIKDEEITFNFSSNTMVRVYHENNKVIEKVPLEEYVIGVVSAEMPMSFEIEALKAQAVASRTYVMYQIQNNRNKDFDVYDSVNSQVYLTDSELKDKWGDNYSQYINKIRKIILDTLGQYLVYDDKIIEAFFFSTSVGYTENSEDVFSEQLPYLRSVESKWDKISPVYTDSKKISKNEFLKLLGLDFNNSINIEILEKTNTGRIKSLKINGKKFSGKEVCSKLKLRSTFFEIITENDMITINTTGYGHGVGMSQYGANGMALDGYSYKEILQHYYTDVKIKKI